MDLKETKLGKDIELFAEYHPFIQRHFFHDLLLVLKESAFDGTDVVFLAEMSKNLFDELVLLQGFTVLRWFFGVFLFWLLCWYCMSINLREVVYGFQWFRQDYRFLI